VEAPETAVAITEEEGSTMVNLVEDNLIDQVVTSVDVDVDVEPSAHWSILWQPWQPLHSGRNLKPEKAVERRLE
jgi:hypothetical protein